MELRSTIKFALLGNLIAFAIIYAIESTTQFFGIKYPSDYAFFVLMLLWGSAALLYMYPPGKVAGLKIEPESEVEEASSEESTTPERYDENTSTCIKLLVSGSPALVYCIINQLIG